MTCGFYEEMGIITVLLYLYITGPVIGLEINGDGCIQYCQEVTVNVMKGTTGLVFVSQSVESAAKQLDDFYNFAELMMSIWELPIFDWSVSHVNKMGAIVLIDRITVYDCDFNAGEMIQPAC